MAAQALEAIALARRDHLCQMRLSRCLVLAAVGLSYGEIAVTAAVNRCATQNQGQNPMPDTTVESHPCAKNAQGWGTRTSQTQCTGRIPCGAIAE
jgi:hypothetical protein